MGKGFALTQFILALSLAACQTIPITNKQETQQSVTDPKEMQMPDYYGRDPYSEANWCTGEQSVGLPSGNTVTIPLICGETTIDTSTINTQTPDGYFGAANIYLTPTHTKTTADGEFTFEARSMVFGFFLNPNLDACTEEWVFYKESVLHAIVLEIIKNSGLTDEWFDYNKGEYPPNTQSLILGLTDSLAIQELSNLLDRQITCELDPNFKLDLMLIKSKTGSRTLRLAVSDGILSKEEWFQLVDDSGHIIKILGNAGFSEAIEQYYQSMK